MISEWPEIPATVEAEAGGSRVWGQLGLESVFVASLENLARPCFKKKKQNKKEERKKRKKKQRAKDIV